MFCRKNTPLLNQASRLSKSLHLIASCPCSHKASTPTTHHLAKGKFLGKPSSSSTCKVRLKDWNEWRMVMRFDPEDYLHYGDGHIHNRFPCWSHDFTASSPAKARISHSSNGNVNWMWRLPIHFMCTSYWTHALWRYWEVFTRYSHTLHLMHVRLRNWLRSCSRRDTIPIHDLADFPYGSQLLLIMADFGSSQQFPMRYIITSKCFPYSSHGLLNLNRTLHSLFWFSTPLGPLPFKVMVTVLL